LSNNEFSFIKDRSTVLLLLKVLDAWTETLDNGGCLDDVYCDFMKAAADKVPRARLIKKRIKKLQSYGIKREYTSLGHRSASREKAKSKGK